MELFDNYKNYTNNVLKLNMDIFTQEKQQLEWEEEVRNGIQNHNFEWQKNINDNINKIKIKISIDQEDLDYAQRRLLSIRDEISRKFPEMSSNVAGLDNGSSTLGSNNIDDGIDGGQTTEAVERDATNAFAEGSIPVYCWLLGRLTFDGKICNMLFGQFSKDIEPPKENWIYVGKNVDRNLVSSNATVNTATMTKTVDGTFISKEQKDEEDAELSQLQSIDDKSSDSSLARTGTGVGVGLTSHAEKDHVLNDFDMLLAKDDVIHVVKRKYKHKYEYEYEYEYFTCTVL